MYHLIFLLICSSMLDLSAQGNDSDVSDWSPGEYMRQATDNVFEKASLMNALSEFTFSDNLCLAGAIVEVGGTIVMDVALRAGQSYTFLGGGDDDVVDLDMYVVDRNEVIVASDVEDDDTPIPDFTADYDGRYSVRLQLVSGQAPTSFVSFAMLTNSGGTSIEEEKFAQISDAFFADGSQLNSKSEGTKWHDLKNQWCFFGVLIDDRASWEFDNLRLGNENHLFFATGPEDLKKIELVLKTDEGVVVASQAEKNAAVVLSAETIDKDRYLLRLVNAESKGKSLVLLGILSE
jgi:hypothetical protein